MTASLPQRILANLKTEAGRQTALLYGAQLASSVLNFLYLTALARSLGRSLYALYALAFFSIISFFGGLFDFGVFPAGARLLAIAPDRDAERRTLGALFAAGLAIGAAFSLLVLACGPLVDRIYEPSAPVAPMLAAAAPFAFVVPLQLLVELACTGTNRIVALALSRVALPVAGLSLVGVLYLTLHLAPWTAIIASLGGIAASVAVAAYVLRPSFVDVRAEMGRLAVAVREFGFQMYLGRCVGLISSRLDQVLIPLFIGEVLFGVYNIAQRISEPVATLARSMAMTRFKAFAGRTHVSSYIIRWNLALLSAAVVALAVGGPIAVNIFFGEKWQPVKPLLIPFAFVAFFGGLMQPYNMFLTAHGKGRELRNISLALGLVNAIGLVAIVKPLGVLGAAVWAAGMMAFNFLLNLYYYRRIRKDLETQADEQ